MTLFLWRFVLSLHVLHTFVPISPHWRAFLDTLATNRIIYSYQRTYSVFSSPCSCGYRYSSFTFHRYLSCTHVPICIYNRLRSRHPSYLAFLLESMALIVALIFVVYMIHSRVHICTILKIQRVWRIEFNQWKVFCLLFIIDFVGLRVVRLMQNKVLRHQAWIVALQSGRLRSNYWLIHACKLLVNEFKWFHFLPLYERLGRLLYK